MNKLLFTLLLLLGVLIVTVIMAWNSTKSADGEITALNSYVDFIERVHSALPCTRTNIDIPLYYINLERSADRRQWMESQIKQFHITQAERIAGVEGRSDPSISYVSTFNNLSPNEIGCTLSHLRAIKQAYDRNLEYVLIVEDDASLLLSPYWEQPLSQYIAQAPSDWEVLKLFWDITTDIHLSNETSYCSLPRQTIYTVSYIINRSAMGRILERALRQERFYLGRDLAPQGVADTYIFALLNNTSCIEGVQGRIYHLYPALIFPNNSVLASTIHNDHTPLHIRHAFRAIVPYIDKVLLGALTQATPEYIPILVRSKIKMYRVQDPTQIDIILHYTGGEVHWLTRILDTLDPKSYRLFVYHQGLTALTIPREYIHQHILLQETGGACGSFAYHVWRFQAASTLLCSEQTVFVSSLQPVPDVVIRGEDGYEFKLDTIIIPTPACLDTLDKWKKLIGCEDMKEGDNKMNPVSRDSLHRQPQELWTRVILTLGYGQNIETEHYLAQMWSSLLS